MFQIFNGKEVSRPSIFPHPAVIPASALTPDLCRGAQGRPCRWRAGEPRGAWERGNVRSGRQARRRPRLAHPFQAARALGFLSAHTSWKGALVRAAGRLAILSVASRLFCVCLTCCFTWPIRMEFF